MSGTPRAKRSRKRSSPLLRKLSNVRFLTDHTAVDLLTVPHHSKDPRAYYREPRLPRRLRPGQPDPPGPDDFRRPDGAGHGRMRRRLSQHVQPGDGRSAPGYAMALRAGARIAHMEYIQFHPTVLYHRDADGFLISETVRGEGARLKTFDGRTFMDKLGGLKDLAPRDEVSRAIYEEMILTNATHVLLDLASYAKVDVKSRFPNIYETCLRYGIDISREPIPVVPAAHYCCGGVLVDDLGKDLAPRALRRRRSELHRTSRRQPPGLDLASRRAGLGNAGRPPSRRRPDSAGRLRRERHPRMV